jgi:hypothetical protein
MFEYDVYEAVAPAALAGASPPARPAATMLTTAAGAMRTQILLPVLAMLAPLFA